MNHARIAGKRGLRALVAALTLCCAVAGAEDRSWMDLERGKVLYSERKFGEALLVFNRAVSDRNESFKAYGDVLSAVMSTKQAKRADGSIRRLLGYFSEADLRKGEIEAIRRDSGGSLSREIAAYEKFRISDPFQNLIDVLQAALDFRSQDFFNDSLAELADFVESRRFFPEAEYWIGMVFLAEGEYEIAQKQVEKALGRPGSLDVPEFANEMRYLQARIHKTRKNYSSMESAYRAILSADPLYQSESEKSLREAMKRVLATEGIEKFLILYRHDAFFAAKAYSDLGEYYYKSGRYTQAIDHLMLASCVLTTRLMEGLMVDDAAYRFSTLSDLLEKVEASEKLSAYAEENGYKRVLYYLGAALKGDGRTTSALGLFKGLARSGGSWAELAGRQLESPFSDKAEEDPEF